MDFHNVTATDLLELGWVRWNDETDLYLCPLAQLPDLPDGIALHSISGAVAVKGRDPIDDDTRGGFIAYGIIPDQTTTTVTALEVQKATALRSADMIETLVECAQKTGVFDLSSGRMVHGDEAVKMMRSLNRTHQPDPS